MKSKFKLFYGALISAFMVLFMFTNLNAQTGSIAGFVTDATNGEAIEGATVTIATLSATTSSDGAYSITGVPVGALNADFTADVTSGDAPLDVSFTSTSTDGGQDITAAASGYTTYSSSVMIYESTNTSMDISLSPTLTDGLMRIVLNWDDDPADLDSHVKTPGGTHVYYGNRGSSTSEPFVLLDHDDTDGYGPETVTFYDFSTGTYNYYIKKFSGTQAITESNAVVQLYDQSGLKYTVYVPTTGTGVYWHVFDIDGATQEVTLVNQITDTEPGWIDKSPKATKAKDITSYNWNFGDGSSSTDANPGHTYTSPGTYSVSLTVSNGSTTDTETKTSYINVSGTGGASMSGYVTDATNGEPVAGATVEIAGLSDLTDEYGFYEISGIPEGALASDFFADVTTGDSPLFVNFTSTSTDGGQIVTVTAADYTTYTSSINIVSGATLTRDFSLSPTLTDGLMRIVLNWDDDPRDLDSHVKTPGGTHLYYGNRGSSTSEPFVLLDHDDTDGYGPETVTFYDFSTGTYNYYIKKFAGTEDITQSDAVVQLYNQGGLQYTVYVPTTGTGVYWHVFDIDGATQAVTLVNQITDSEPGWIDKSPKAAKAKEITSYSWDFGDGGTSTAANPGHTYESAGTYTVSLTVSNGTETDTETKTNYITVNQGETQGGTIQGYVSNAVDGTAIENALVEIAGLSSFTDANGYYEIADVPVGMLNADFIADYQSGNPSLTVQFTDQSTEGAQTLNISATGFSDYTNNQVTILPEQTVTMNVSLSPTLASGQMRIVLNWGESPEDLDSHLKTPEIEGTEYHVYWSNDGSAETAPYAVLDYDYTNGYGPETITLYQFFSGTYHYYIKNYSETPDITTSGAVVQVYNDAGIIQTAQVPTSGSGLYWHVFDIDGATQNITLINEITDIEPGMIFPNEKSEKLEKASSITSWSWNFGDGGTSDQQNPSHTYNSEGVYTVSLTVSDDVSSDTETKTDFISIYATDVQDVQGNEDIAIYPNPSEGEFILEIDNEFGTFTNLQVQNIQGQIVYEHQVTTSGRVVKELDLTNYGEGVYFIRVQHESETNFYKVIVR